MQFVTVEGEKWFYFAIKSVEYFTLVRVFALSCFENIAKSNEFAFRLKQSPYFAERVFDGKEV